MAQNFYSQAGNFTGSSQSGVDTRTGLYKSNFPIVNIVANHGIGPVQDITLSYAPLETVNKGFGQGWSLGMSYYDKPNGLLVTANGDQYQIVENTTSVLIQQNKLDNIRFEKFTDHYKLIYKSGVVEIFSSPTSVNNIKVPVTIYSPIGRSIQLKWELSASFPKLLSIQDEEHTLLNIAYSGFTTITVWPGSIEEKTIRLIQTNSQLTSFSIIRDEDSPLWTLTYKTLGSNTLLSGMTTPSGMSESVVYVASQCQFPTSAKQTALPRVTSHTRNPGAQQPPIQRTYQYSTYNFLGYGTAGTWSSSTDYLYNLSTNYTYWSEERLTNGDELIVTRRTFDHFHLLREESTVQNKSHKVTVADYYAIDAATYTQQPDNFLCQKNKVVTYTDTATNTSRTETTAYEYSLDGNLLSQTEPDGKVTSWEYYPAEGAVNCPADPHGFCRYMKSETITPAVTEFDTPVKSKHYEYIDIAIATSAQEHLERAVVQELVLSASDKKELMDVVQTYGADNSSPYYGRAIKQLISKAGIEGGELDYVSVEDTDWQAGDEYALRTVTYYPYDYIDTNKNNTSRTVEYYPLSLKERIVTDGNGNTMEYFYDEMDRLTQSVKNKGTIYEANVYYTYQMEEVEPETGVYAPVMIVKDEKGNTSKNMYDGLGNLIRQSKLVDNVWNIILERQFDAFGRECYNDRRDQLNNVEAIVSQNLSYNDWGLISSIKYNDGHYEYNNYDPTLLQSTLWQESVDERVGDTITQYNVNGAVVSQSKLNEAGNIIGTKRFHYDGLGQLREMVDENDITLTYDYDSYGRVKTTTLGDGTVIKKIYAPHTSEKLITHIYVNDNLIGQQTFDGLSRLKESTVAGRTQQYLYNTDSASPYQVTMPDGSVLQYEYINQLDDAIESIKDGNGTLLQSMTYDPVNGNVLTGTTTEGVMFTNTYNDDATLSTETFSDNDRKVSAQYTFSNNGILLNYVGVDNSTRHSSFNSLGQCLNVVDGNITLDNEFDSLGRIQKITTTDKKTSSVSVTEIHYDRFGREWTRDFSCRTYQRNVEQLYYPNDMLQTRTTRQGTNVLLTEDYTYNNRNQLYTYIASGSLLPKDKYGNSITKQTFTYDELGNIQTAETQFTVGSNTAKYHYELNDPCQLKRVENSHSAYPAETILQYDLSGRLTSNEVGNTLTYDALGHLSQVLNGKNVLATYHYDAMDRMVRQLATAGGNTQLYYRDSSVVTEYSSSTASHADFVKVANNTLARTDVNEAQLYMSDFKGTPLGYADLQNDTSNDIGFTAYGESSSDDLPTWSPAFNGQVRDSVTGYYHLGNGYRAYNPELMRFNTPDSWSPFGAGGINPYAYCQNDPINFVDPTGHISWQNGVAIGFSVLSILLTIVTAGAAIIVAGGVAAAVASAGVAAVILGTVSVVGDIASITSNALEETHPDIANAFSWVSKACSVISLGSTIKSLPKTIKEAPDKIYDVWSKVRGKTGSAVITKVHDTRKIMVRTADRYLKIKGSTAFSIGYHVVTGGTKMGISIYDYVSQKKEDASTGEASSDSTSTNVTNNTLMATGDLKTGTTSTYSLSSSGMQTTEDAGIERMYSSLRSEMTDALAPLASQLKKTGVRLVNEDSLIPWASTVTTEM